MELLIPHDDTPPSLNLITLGLMITHQHQFVNLSLRNLLRLFPACCLGKGKLGREISFVLRKRILNTSMHNKYCNHPALTMYALEIIPRSSSVTSINPSQSHSPSSWITSNLILIIYKSKQTNLVLAEADGEVMTPHQLSHINFLAFHLIKFAQICTNWSRIDRGFTEGSSGSELNSPILATCFTRFTCFPCCRKC